MSVPWLGVREVNVARADKLVVGSHSIKVADTSAPVPLRVMVDAISDGINDLASKEPLRSAGVRVDTSIAGSKHAWKVVRAADGATEAALEGAIRDASSRARLARTAEERLGMRIPPESLVIRLPRPSPDVGR